MGKYLGKPGSVAVRPAVLQKAQSQLPSHAVVLSCHMARRDWRVTKGCSWPSSNRNKAVPCKSPNPGFKMHQFLCTYSNTGRFYIILPRDLFSRQILNFHMNSNFLLLSFKTDNSPNDEIFWLQSGFCWKEASSFLRNSTISLCNELLHTQCSIIYWFYLMPWFLTSFISSMYQLNCSHFRGFSLSFHALRAIFLNIIKSSVGYRIHTYKLIGPLPGSDLQLSSHCCGRSFKHSGDWFWVLCLLFPYSLSICTTFLEWL